MIDALVGALTGANAGLDLIKRAVAARDQDKIESAVAGVVEKLREAQLAALQTTQEALKLTQDARSADHRIAELERQVQELQTKADLRARYELVPVSTGAFAYALKDPEERRTSPHYVCQSCLESGKHVLLQRSGATSILKCPSCPTAIRSDVLAAEVAASHARVSVPPRAGSWDI